MYKTLTLAAFFGLVGLAQPIAAQSQIFDVDVAPKSTDFSFPQTKGNTTFAPGVSEAVDYALQPKATKPKAQQIDSAPTLTNVTDTAARPPFWSRVDLLVIVLVALSAIFMRLLMVRQRRSRRSDGIFVETIR